MPEKLGQPGLPRPEGRLIWLHAVGLGEVLALRGLIAAMARQMPDLEFLVTSSARSSAQVFARQCPPRTRHQFLPLDAPAFYGPFLDHWRPDLSIWTEQDLWPAIIAQTDCQGIPLAWINARITEESARKRARFKGLYRDLIGRFSLISAQEPATAARIARFAPRVTIDTRASIKRAAPPLDADPDALLALQAAIGSRPVWLVGPSHIPDEGLAIAAHRIVLAQDPDALLIIAPRDPARGTEIAALVRAQSLQLRQRGKGELPTDDTQVFIADSFGEMGLWYRLADTALIGGSFHAVEGHNPWEAAQLDCAILHGPQTANFQTDYAALDAAGAALRVEDPEQIAKAVQSDLSAMRARATACCAQNTDGVDDLAARLLALLPQEAA